MPEYSVTCTCHRCHGEFTVKQSSPWEDEDITVCWVCINDVFTGKKP